MELKLDDGSFINFDFPTLRVKVFKSSGKWVASKSTTPSGGNIDLIFQTPWRFIEQIEKNNLTIRDFSPIGGFPDGYYYSLEGYLPSHIQGFCTFIIDKTKGDKN